jgi:hypothetical protein
MKSVQICGDNRSTDNNACFIEKIYKATLIMFFTSADSISINQLFTGK